MTKFYIFLFITTFFNCTTIAQINLDSLRLKWNDTTQTDTVRLQALHQFINERHLFSNPDSSIYYARLEYQFAEQKKVNKYMGNALNLLGISYYIQSNYDSAQFYFKKSLQIRNEVGIKSDISASLSNIGAVYKNQGYYDKSISYFEKSLAMDKETGNQEGYASTNANIGSIYIDLGYFSKATDYINKSLEIMKEIGDKQKMAIFQNNLGLIYKIQGNYDQAIKYYSKSLTLRKEIGDKKGIAGSLNNLGNVQKAKKDYHSALSNYSKSLQIKKEIGHQYGIAVSYTNIGLIHYLTGKYLKSLEYHLKSLQIHQQIGDQKGMAIAYNNISKVYFATDELDSAKKYGIKSNNLAQEIGAYSEIRSSSANLLQLFLSTGMIQSAVEYSNALYDLRLKDLDINFPTLSEIQKEKYFATMSNDFDLLYDFALKQPQLSGLKDRAYTNALIIKGLLLKSSTAMRNTILNSGDSLLIEEYNEWISLKRRIAKSYAKGNEIKQLEVQANNLEQHLASKSQEFSDYKNVQQITWKDVQTELKEDETAIEFIKFNHQDDYKNNSTIVQLYAALIVNKETKHPQLVPLFEEHQLEEIIGTFGGNNISYIEELYGSRKNTKTQLYNLIWKPLEPHLKNAEKIYLSPVGLLHKISFAALAKEKDVYLCDLYEVQTQSSTSKLVTGEEVNFNKNDQCSIFGGVEYNSDRTEKEIWSYLEGTKKETEDIAKILKKKKVDYNYYTGSEASENQLKEIAKRSDILHIATHGFFYANPDEVERSLETEEKDTEQLVFRGGTSGFGYNTFVQSRNPLMRSGIVFAGANDVWSKNAVQGEDGVLTAQEVVTLDLRKTDLVVLSACETGLGDIKGSEGVYGLQRAFKMAGAKYLIMSLWQVPDKETAEFMTTFYKKLAKTNDIKKSFNQTQKDMREKYDPYYWAAFVLIE